MSKDLVNVVILSAYFLLLFGGAEVLFYYFKWKAEHTRKVVHFGTGILTFLFPIMLSHHLWVLLLCASFAVLLLMSMKFNFLNSINGVDRITWGSLCFPLSVYLCFAAKVYFQQDLLFYLPMLILAISDPAAALIGKASGWRPYQVWGQTKTWAGSMAFFVSAFCLTFGFHRFFQHHSGIDALIFALFVGIFSALTEAFSTKGWDNLNIPISVILFEWLLDKFL